MSKWTQPICTHDWVLLYGPRIPHRVRSDTTFDGELECCCYCGALTASGIYIRTDPDTIPYPRRQP